MGKLLLVDDDVTYCDQLQTLLKPHGWTIETANTGGDALQLLENFTHNFVLLDWNLPDITGLEICQKFRQKGGETPIIFLTGRDEVEDKEAGLDAGGDDYLTKPFDVRELLARIRTVQRRPPQITKGKFVLQEVRFDPRLRSISASDEQIQLLPTESSMIEVLCRNPGTFFSSAKMFEAIWPSDTDSSDEAVRVHMRVLRRKLALITSRELIKTVRGAGYCIDAENVGRE